MIAHTEAGGRERARPKVLLGHRYFAPDTSPYGILLADIARMLSEDFEVNVVTCQPTYARDSLSRRQPGFVDSEGVCVYRLSPTKLGARWGTFIDHVRFAVFFVAKSLQSGPHDIVMTSTMPPVVSGAAGLLAAKLSKAAFIYHLQDIHPEVVRGSTSVPRGLFALLRFLDTKVCGWADAVVVLSEDMRESLAARGLDTSNIKVINNFELPDSGPTQPIVPVTSVAKKARRFQLLFAGNVGRFQGLGLVLDALELVQHRNDLEFFVMGDGSFVPEITRRSARLPRGLIRHEPRQPVTVAKQAMVEADLNLVSLSPGTYKYAYPSKATTLRALGAAILAVVEPASHLADDVRRRGAGFTVPNGDPRALARLLEHLLDNPQVVREAKEAARERAAEVDRATIGRVWHQLFWDVKLSRSGEASYATGMNESLPLRFRWDHRHPVHRRMVRGANKVLAQIPASAKYAAGSAVRRSRLPYSLVHPDSTIVQIGAPSDTLASGRSRGMHFALRSAPLGRAIIIEPDDASRQAFEKMADDLGLHHCQTVPFGAWSHRDKLRFFRNPAHPATNFTAGTTEMLADAEDQYEEVAIEVRSLDEICHDLGVEQIDVLSITTNGAEVPILNGMKQLLKDRAVRYVCIAITGDGLVQEMEARGYKVLGYDDRGYTFCQNVGGGM